VLESQSTLKIGHDFTNDVKWLQKDFGIFLVAAVDTQIMYKILHGENNIGFEKLARTYHPALANAFPKETMSDWRLRPGKGMTMEQEKYATNDVHVLLRIFDELRSEVSVIIVITQIKTLTVTKQNQASLITIKYNL
jgi:ribonuclease D